MSGATDRSFSGMRADVKTMQKEQIEDGTLKGWWSLRAKRGKGGFFVKDCLLYLAEKILGQSFSHLCLLKTRTQVLELAHDTFGGHLGEKRTRERICLSFTWPTLTSDCKRYCQTLCCLSKTSAQDIQRPCTNYAILSIIIA